MKKLTTQLNNNFRKKTCHLSLKKPIEIGIVSGFVGGLAIFLTIFAIDTQLNLLPGTFYKVIGIPVGLDGIFATIFGMIVHMGTAALIGAVFCVCSSLHKRLEIKTPKKEPLQDA